MGSFVLVLELKFISIEQGDAHTFYRLFGVIRILNFVPSSIENAVCSIMKKVLKTRFR